ncbi:putative integral membrane protein [Leishmania donovani]|uniref:Putative integral membrane protein n=1 Tax=Leishmania donovani TaxID=5661 RepID=A0A504XT63_LEIDO|nr:putative integral membrane protein [Leishmania donovani]
MIFIEPDVDYFRLHLRDVHVPVPVLEQGPDAIAAATTAAPTSARATVVPQCKEPNDGDHDAPLPHKGLKVGTATETAGFRRSGSAMPSVSSSTDPSKVLAAEQEHLHRCESGNDDYRGLVEDEAASCAKITLEERADVVHRALLSALHARFPYEAVDTLEYVYILVVTHHVAPSLATQAFNEGELGSLTSLSGLLPEELRDRTFPSHLNAVLDPASAFAAETTSTKPMSPETATGVAADSAAASSAIRPSIRVTDDDAAARAAREKESAARAIAQVLHNVPTAPHFFDSIFLLSRALTPEQQALYCDVQRCGRRLVSCEAVHHATVTAAKAHRGGGTNTQMESFSVIQGRFVHCLLLQPASPATTLAAARSLYFSVYRIPLSRFRPAEQQYYADQREELRWRQRHRCRSSYRKLQRKGQPVEQVSGAVMPSCGSWCHPLEESGSVDAARDSCSCSCGSESEDDEEDWEGEVRRSTGKAVSSLSSAKSWRTRDAADAIDRLLGSEGHGVGDAAEQTSTAEQRSAARFFRTCHEVLTNYAIAHSPYAARGAVEKEETAARTKATAHGAPSPSSPAVTAAVPSSAHQRQQHPRMPWFPRRFAGVSYVGVTRLLYSLAPCDCYHLVMKDHSPFYYAHSSRSSYERQTVPLCLVSDLSSETGGDGGGALQLAQLKSKPLSRATAASAAPATALASVAEARRRRFGEQKVQVAPPRARSPEPGVTEQVLLPERAERPSYEARVAAAATRNSASNPPPSSASPQSRGSLVSATDGFLRMSVSLIRNNISGSPQARQQSLTEKGVHVPSFLLPDDVRTRGGTDAGPSCRNPRDAASADGGAAAAAVNLFKALSQSSLAQHKLRYGCIRSVISVAVLDSSQRMPNDSPAVCSSGGANSDGARRYGTLEAAQMQLSQRYCCRGLVDHTWLSIPVQRTPAEQDAIQWMPVMLGSTDCVSDVGLRTAVHLGIFPRASPPSRGASGGPAGLTAVCLSTPSDQLDGVLPTRAGALSSLQPFEFRGENPTAALRQAGSSGAAAAADNALAGARLSNDKKGMSKVMPPVAPLRARPVNGADDGARSSTFSAVGRLEQARTPLTSFATLHTKGGVPLAFDFTGGRQSHAVPRRGTTPRDRLSFTTTKAKKGEMGSEHAHVDIDDEEEQVRAPTPSATATSVRIERGGIALTFDAGPAQQRKTPSSSATGGAPTTCRRRTDPATTSARYPAEFPRDCSRYEDDVMKGKDDNEESVEVASDFSDGNGDDPERRLLPSCARTPERTPRALARTPPRGNQVARELAAAEDADSERRRGGGSSKISERVSGAITAAPKSYCAGTRGSPQAATKTINWADKLLPNAKATRAGSRNCGSLRFPSVLHTEVEDKEQLDANRSVRGRGAALMPTTYGAAAERRAGVFGISGSNNIRRSSGPLPASLPAPRSNPFLMQTHKTPTANSNQPYDIDAGTSPRPSPLSRCFAGYTPFQPASGLPQHVPQHQQQTPIPDSRPTSVSATPTPTPTQCFSVPFTPFGQGAGSRYQTTAPTLQQQLLPHTNQHGARATGFAAVAAPHSHVPPSTVELSASGVTATPTATSDGGTAPHGAQSAASPPAYFAMAWNARKTAPQQHGLSGGIAEHPSSSASLSPLPRHTTHEQAQAPQSRPCISFYPPFAAARSAPSLSAQLLSPSAYYTPPARQTIGAGRLSLFSSPLAPRRGSVGGGPATLAVDACGLSRSLFIDEYDDGAATAGSASHLRGDGRAASRVRPRGVSAMDAAWWQPIRELTSAPNLRHGAAAPAAGHSRSSTSALRLSVADQPYNLPLGSTSNPHNHHGSRCGDCGGCRKGCATAAGDPALQQRSRHSYYHEEASSLGRGTATAPVHPGRAAVPPLPSSRLGGLQIDARNAENQNVDDAYVEELSLSPVTPHRTQMRTPFAVRRARRAAATTGHSFRLSSRRRPPLAPRSVGSDAARGSSCDCAEANAPDKFRSHYGAATPSSAAAWRDGLSVRERVQLRRWRLDKEERLASYQAHLQANYLCGSMPKRYCFERQTGGAAADARPAPLGGGVARESGVTGSGEQPQSAAGGYAVWTPRTTAVPPVGHETAAVLQVGKSARDFSLGVHSSAPVSTATSAPRDASSLLLRPPTASASTASGAGGPDVDAARVCQAEAHRRQQASKQSQIEARQQMEALADGAAAARLATGVNVSFTLRDVATVFLRLPSTSLHASRTPGTEPWHVSGGAGLDVLDVCDAVRRTEGVSCFLSRKPTQLRGGWASYLERINLYQEPFFLRDQAFVLVLPVPHVPTLKVCVAIHNINDLLALVCQTPVARILPTAEETWMRQHEYGFEDANDDAEGRQDGAVMAVAERRWLFGLFTTRRLVPAAGTHASRKAHQQLPSPEDNDVARREKCRRLRREYQVDGLCLTWRHRARLWYALLRAGLSCLALPTCTSPLLIDPVACKARCALLCDRIAAYAVAHRRLEALKAVRQSRLVARAAEVSKERVLKFCDRAHHGTARGIQLGRTGDSSSRVAASRSRCTPSPLLLSVPTRQQRRVSGVGDDGVDSTVCQGRYPVTWGRACDSTLRTDLHNRFSSTDEAARDPQVARGGVASTLETPSTVWGRPLFAASTSAAPLHSGHFETSRQRFEDRCDERQQRAGTPIPPRLSAMGGISHTYPSLRQRTSSGDRWATPRTTRSMQLRLAANQRVAAGDAPVSSLRHATHASVLGEGRLTSNDGERFSDARDGAVDVAWRHAHTCGDAVATSCRRGSTLARTVAGAPGIASVNVPYDVEAGSHPYASDGALGAMRAARSATVAAGHERHASSAASHGLFAPAASTVAPYASGTSIAPSSDAQATAAAENGPQRVILSPTTASSLALSAAAASTNLDLVLRVDRDDALAGALARLTEHRAVNIAPPLVTVLSIVPLAAQPVRGAGAGVVEDSDAPTISPADTGAASPLYPGFIPTPLEVQQRLAQPFNLSIAQVQQLLQWQWEHHQHCYTLMPVPLFTGAAAGPTEVDFSLRFWSSPQGVDSVSRGGPDERASAASPSYAVSPLARELLLHLLRWSWLLPIDYEASRRSRRHRLAATTTSSLASLFRCLISPSPLRCPRWRMLALIVLLVTAAGRSARCLQALLFGGVGYCALSGVAVGLLARLPSHRGASSRHSRGGCLPWQWWWGRRSTGAADVHSQGHRRSASRLVRRPLSALQNDVPPIDDRVSLLYSLGESTTHDMLERRRVHFAAQAVLVRVLCLQSAAASLLSRLQLFFYGYSTALSFWVALLLFAYALLCAVYLEAVLAVQQSLGGAAWSAECDGCASAGAVSAFWQVARRIPHVMWWGTNAASTTSFHPSQSAASALTGAAWREVLASARYILFQRQRTVVDGGGEAAAAGVASALEVQPFGDSDPAVEATARSGGSAGAGAAHGHHRSPSYFYQNGKYFAYDAEPPAWAKSEAAAAIPSNIGATPGAHYERVSAQPQRQEPSPSARVVQSLSEWFSHIVQGGGSDGNDGGGKHRPSVLSNHSADPMGSNSTYITANSSAAYVCSNKSAGSSVGDPSVLWFLVVAYVVTVCLPWSPYRWLWRRVWSVLTHDDALATVLVR